MKVLLAVIAVVLLVGFLALAGTYALQEGINQAIEWRKQKKKAKERQENAEF